MATPIQKPTYETRYRINKAGQRIAYRVLVREPPVINSYDDAVAHDLFKGNQFEGTWKGGVFSGLGYELIQAENLYKFRLKSGYGTIFGRQYEIEDDYDIDLSSLTGKNYCVVYAEVNLNYITKSYFNIRLAHAGAGYPDIPTDDLIARKQGVARMPLYRFIYKASGSDRFTAVTCLFYTYSNGVAEKVRVMDHDAKWNGRTLSNLFYYNADRFMKANKALYTDLAKSIGTTGKWVAYDDQMSVKASNESKERNILMVTNNVFRVKGKDVKNNIDSNKRFLVENKTYWFGYANGEPNPVPPDATVVGVIVSGYIKLWYWKNNNKGWVSTGGDSYMSAQHQRYTTWANFVAIKEKQRMFPGAIYYGQREMYITCVPEIKNYIIFEETIPHGAILNDGSTKCWCGNQQGLEVLPKCDNFKKVATLYFHSGRGEKPEICVKVADDWCIECDLTFRPMYIRGTDGYEWEYTDCWEIVRKSNPNPFSSLNPQLEGGQT